MANISNDANLPAAIAARLERQQALHDKNRHFEFLMTEAALRWRPGPPELLAAQLDHIAALATLDTINLGVIPMDAEMHAITRCSFILYEDRATGSRRWSQLRPPTHRCTRAMLRTWSSTGTSLPCSASQLYTAPTPWPSSGLSRIPSDACQRGSRLT